VCGTGVSDLSPLQDLRLVLLDIQGTRVTSLEPIRSLPLEKIILDYRPERDAAVLRSLKTLKTINRMPADEFWKNHAE
jgi:hypothetical protein